MKKSSFFIILCCLISLAYPTSVPPPTPKTSTSQPVIQSKITESAIESQAQSKDYFENYNRNAYRMNDKLDKTVVRPAAVGYVTYVPLPIRTALANFFNNLRDFVTLGNDILQLNGKSTMKNIMRISINTTIGLVGLIDVSSSLGLVQNKNSFGNTMKVYGWTNSSYYVIPLLGPSTVRDAIGLIPDTVFNPTWYLIGSDYISIGLYVLNAINTRSQFLGFDQILNTSIDPYVTLRDTYLSTIGEIPAMPNESQVSIDSLLDDSPESELPEPKSVPKQ